MTHLKGLLISMGRSISAPPPILLPRLALTERAYSDAEGLPADQVDGGYRPDRQSGTGRPFAATLSEMFPSRPHSRQTVVKRFSVLTLGKKKERQAARGEGRSKVVTCAHYGIHMALCGGRVQGRSSRSRASRQELSWTTSEATSRQ